jgi:hypothetical protein
MKNDLKWPGGLAALCAAFTPSIAFGQMNNHKEPPMVGGIAFNLDEDAFNLVRPSDRNYTGGGAFIFTGAWVDKAFLTKPIDLLDRLTPTHLAYDYVDELSTTVVRDYEMSFGVTIFTPINLRTAAAIHDDRPYSALDFIHVSHTSYSERIVLPFIPGAIRGFEISSDFTLGILGLSQGHDLQAFIHRTIRTDKNEVCNPNNLSPDKPPEPCGWKNQISDGGEPTFLYGVHAQQLVAQRDFNPYFSFDAAATGFAEVGYYVDASVGAEARIGIIKSPFWQAKTAPLNFAAAAAGSAPARALKGIELYLFGGARGRLVAYNALLEGQFRSSAVRVVAAPGVGEFEAGVTATLWVVTLSWTPFAGRTADFFGDSEGLHMWTSFFIGGHGSW